MYMHVLHLCSTPVPVDPCVEDVDTMLQWCGKSLLEHWGSRAAADLVLPACPRHEGDRLRDPVVGSPTVPLEVVR